MHRESPATQVKNYMQTQQTDGSTTFLVAPKPGQLYVMRRDNRSLVPFNADKIHVAITKAYLAVEGGNAAASRRVHEVVDNVTAQVTKAVSRYLNSGGIVRLEEIQDQVELALMREDLHKVARTYILYREERRQARETSHKAQKPAEVMNVTLDNGQRVPLDEQRLNTIVQAACQ